ncbi:MAG TPA: GtrA family protein [Saprospiraceae bacterium]|nr:GtrA family protein [Saprospiraceae bacterium]
MFQKFIKFGVVGFTGLIIDFSITYILKERIKLNRYVANSCGFTAAASSNYLLNRVWTFHSTNPRIVIEFTSFLIISFIGLLINNSFLNLFEKKYNFYVAKLFAIGITIIWNFFANYLITFSV